MNAISSPKRSVAGVEESARDLYDEGTKVQISCDRNFCFRKNMPDLWYIML